ncbi:MAG: hypothetical protein HY423_10895 [Candidatus Lambdaproteobacteria bacterium]|nr:hypothetical protein [Candidatus Lambdaproteobacteria bacterium]
MKCIEARRSYGVSGEWEIESGLFDGLVQNLILLEPRVVLALAALLLALVACSGELPAKRTFVGGTQGARETVEVPVGLNPLGTLPTCAPGAPPLPLAKRVLISRPDEFTSSASQMISALREALAAPANAGLGVELVLSGAPLGSAAGAAAEGRRCGAMIVFWEPPGAGTLELILPQPARIPLRDALRPRLCEFGSHAEQVNILYQTVLALVSMLDNDYDKALFYINIANQTDDRCLQLPRVPAASNAR